MRKNRFTEEQMVAIVREADRTTVAEADKNHKVSESTTHKWAVRSQDGAVRQLSVAAGQGISF